MAVLGILAFMNLDDLSARIRNRIPSLFAIVGLAGTGLGLAQEGIGRQRQVTLDATEIVRDLEQGAGMTLVPFRDSRIPLVATRKFLDPTGSTVVDARISDDRNGWARFVVREQVVLLDLRSPVHGAFEMRWAGSGHHVLRQVDPDGMAECVSAPVALTGGRRRISGNATAGTLVDFPGPSPLEIDLMVLYTDDSVTLSGGVAAVEATISSYLAYTNQVYGDSGVHHRIRLVHTEQVSYPETGNILTDLARLQNPSDGFLDGVHSLRDAVGADCVSMITAAPAAGTAYVMTDVSAASEDRAFSVMGHDAGGRAFAHELGHNLGCGHNNGPAAQDAAFCFSYGHRTPDNAWRTIMSSSPGTFVDVFSSPALSFAGLPLGVDGAGCPLDGADCVSTMNMTAGIVAAFRP